jgi:hypothetical protein
MWRRKSLATALVTTVFAGLTAACGSDAASPTCDALSQFNAETLRGQIFSTVDGEAKPDDLNALKGSANQLRSIAAAADEKLKNALNGAALATDDAAKNQPNTKVIEDSFTKLGKGVESACGS